MNVDCDVCVAVLTSMDVLVPCVKCGQLHRKSNMSHHARICCGLSTPSMTPDARGVKSSTAATGALTRSRSSSADTRSSSGAGRQVVSTSIGDAAYSPTQLSTLLNAVILEAVPALLDQHGCYNQNSLVQYLAKFYPEIPEQFRAPIVVAAMAGSRHSALMHLVWEKNISSPDQGKRQFASGAASSLSFWALGMLPVDRSGNVYQRKEAEDSSTTVVHQTAENKSATLEPPTATASEDLPAVQDKAVILNDIIFPAPLRDADEEFEDLMQQLVLMCNQSHVIYSQRSSRSLRWRCHRLSNSNLAPRIPQWYSSKTEIKRHFMKGRRHLQYSVSMQSLT